MAEKQFLTKKGYEERVALLENLKRAGRLIRECRV